jgi:hypothetical protein
MTFAFDHICREFSEAVNWDSLSGAIVTYIWLIGINSRSITSYDVRNEVWIFYAMQKGIETVVP